MNEVAKNKVLLQYVDTVIDAIKHAQDLTDEDERILNLRGVLYYWLGIMFDEGRANAANLEIANEALLKIVVALKAQNKELLKRINEMR